VDHEPPGYRRVCRRLRPDLQCVDGVDELEVGYHVRTSLQGNGYATEAAAASRDFARDVIGASRLIAIIDPRNLPSQRVAAKIGLKFEKRALAPTGAEAVIYAGSLSDVGTA
jgi:RimJ/RimL family protein N-acetyltransferase